MSATMSSVDQRVYNKVMASKKKAMTYAQIESAIPGLGKKEINTAINNILRLKLFTATQGKDGSHIFHGVAVEDAKKQNTLTEEQQFILSIVGRAGNKGISKGQISGQISNETIPRQQVFKAVDTLEKIGLIKSFRGVNQPTVPLYILQHLKPPEDLAGGIWFDESKEYDAVFVESLRQVVLRYVQAKTFPKPKGADSISKLCPNPIQPINKTPGLPTPAEILKYIQANKITSAQLSVKNVMEIARALELDGLIEAIKPIGGVSVMPMYNSDSDGEPVTKRRRGAANDDEDDEERERRERKEKEKAKAKAKERKREERRKEKEKRAKEKEREKKRLREKEKRRKEKEKEKRRKEKEKRKRKEKESERKKSKSRARDLDDSDDELREIGDDLGVKSKRKRVVESDSDSAASSSDSDSTTKSNSDSDTDSDSDDSDSDSDTDSDVSSVASDDLNDRDVSRPAATAPNFVTSNPFFNTDSGGGGFTDLSDQAVVYRATRRIRIPLGQMQAPCGTCPQFSFCEEDGPVNPGGCQYFSSWLSGAVGGWTADVKAAKLKEQQEAERARKRALAEANGETYVEEPAEANGEAAEPAMEDMGEYGEDYDDEEGDPDGLPPGGEDW